MASKKASQLSDTPNGRSKALFRAVIEYDGKNYFGFQRQKEAPTIQGAIEHALAEITNGGVVIAGAGRTDSGVHALGQVITFNLVWSHELEALQRAINAKLPKDIVVLNLAEAPSGFHARYSAKSRYYKYHIYNMPIRSPLLHLRSWHVRRPLNMVNMNRATSMLIGEHDFATFGQPPKGINTVRYVFDAGWQRQDNLLIFNIEANAFLYRMVRSLVGTLKAVGEGNWTVKDFGDALLSRDRSRAGQTAPPQGLFFTSVRYE